MTTPNLATLTASLERSLQNCSLNEPPNAGGDDAGIARSSSAVSSSSSVILDLNSDLSLPYQWEQCLDLKTGSISFINWSNGMRVKEDPRRELYWGDSEDGDVCCNESGEEWCCYSSTEEDETNVLVVAGCRRCLMYYMVPKELQECPKCSSNLLQFHDDSS